MNLSCKKRLAWIPATACLLALICVTSLPAARAADKDDDKHVEHKETKKTPKPADGKESEEHEDDEAEGHIRLSSEQLRKAGIQVVSAGSVSIRQTFPVHGVVTPNAEGIARIAARFPGVIRQFTRKPGEQVAMGDVLATIESNESLKVYSVTATVAGIITDRQGAVGEQTTDTPLFTILNSANLWVELSVFPRDVVHVKQGQTVVIRQPQRGLIAEGRLDYVGNTANPVNQAITVRAAVNNTEGHWIPGHFVSAEVVLSESPAAVAVRNEALQTLDGKTVVFVKEPNGFAPRAVQTGRTDYRYTEITNGLAAGESYVAVNSFILKADLGKESIEDDD
ncbi:efflux RND transporter periplasmic adaptor subunit [Cellvibrio japonicus]|uniref:Possible RND divalent metal cation efflux membrane fusion protein CzcB n=1 Tax=Cellvibrio japonicus (strain Ueda107) TaxID=498211 RepID=B3PFX7_CELJU|nr:efflux RND transporter periplasmic adaptor subunit [Cellvibrio japonicus]ACE84874.1 possible RND divalent metal cation efflux membrane fusion protein CzcB precursor [Cellvibrio japonicus Ueda107]QEI12342.1 HlyD family efflux transporter periplasmic adaptor subunit [Cellvibrio japonicus]QEI15915.1 HlyD family efflux transporter periplasmic adaptor subunit [Cellvibrio japonicus]QEI19494.1 HlyD family efflux transporter periplasmic adaptor subunit [Cellvibrio japonicus]